MTKETIIIKLPLTEKEIEKYYLQNEKYFFKIKVKDSMELTPKQFINYIINIGLDCDLIINETPDTYITEIIKEYLMTNREVSIPILNKIIINALQDIIMKTEYPMNKDFIDNNKEFLLEVIDTLVNLKFATEIMIAGDIYDNEILKLDPVENNIIGNNLISLRKDEAFWNLYMLLEFVEKKEIKYYKNFTELTLKGYSMLYFIVSEKNPIGIAVNTIKKNKFYYNYKGK